MSKKILVVDDSRTDLEMITNTLESKGYDVIRATNGEEALMQVTTQHPDLIVLDVVMPGKDGFQTCRQLKMDENTKDIKIILLTTKDGKTDEYWGRKQGADDYITKPFEPNKLIQRISLLI